MNKIIVPTTVAAVFPHPLLLQTLENVAPPREQPQSQSQPKYNILSFVCSSYGQGIFLLLGACVSFTCAYKYRFFFHEIVHEHIEYEINMRIFFFPNFFTFKSIF
jgi:hypothetical protein